MLVGVRRHKVLAKHLSLKLLPKAKLLWPYWFWKDQTHLLSCDGVQCSWKKKKTDLCYCSFSLSMRFLKFIKLEKTNRDPYKNQKHTEIPESTSQIYFFWKLSQVFYPVLYSLSVDFIWYGYPKNIREVIHLECIFELYFIFECVDFHSFLGMFIQCLVQENSLPCSEITLLKMSHIFKGKDEVLFFCSTFAGPV